jgi:hypothetical protein
MSAVCAEESDNSAYKLLQEGQIFGESIQNVEAMDLAWRLYDSKKINLESALIIVDSNSSEIADREGMISKGDIAKISEYQRIDKFYSDKLKKCYILRKQFGNNIFPHVQYQLDHLSQVDSLMNFLTHFEIAIFRFQGTADSIIQDMPPSGASAITAKNLLRAESTVINYPDLIDGHTGKPIDYKFIKLVFNDSGVEIASKLLKNDSSGALVFFIDNRSVFPEKLIKLTDSYCMIPDGQYSKQIYELVNHVR